MKGGLRYCGIAQSEERLTSIRSSTLLAVQVSEIQNRSISGSKIACALVPEQVITTVETNKKDIACKVASSLK